jgi:hypothetical protein
VRARGIGPALALAGLLAGPALGQAWVAPKGEGWLGLGFQHSWANEHIDAQGNAYDRGTMRGETLHLAGGYVPVERLGLTAGVAFVATRWTTHGSPYAPPGRAYAKHGPHDDGDWHATFQDAHLEVRYRLLDEPLLLTPLVGIVVPIHEYETAGHAGTGAGFVSAPIGLYAGRLLDPLLPAAWFQARYAYTIVEHTHDKETGEILSTNRSNLSVDLGYYTTTFLSMRLIGAFQWGHGGLEEGTFRAGEKEFEDHDRRLRASFQKLGGGATWVLGQFDVSAVALWTLGGKNTARTYTITALVSWNFGRGESFFGTRTRPAPR